MGVFATYEWVSRLSSDIITVSLFVIGFTVIPGFPDIDITGTLEETLEHTARVEDNIRFNLDSFNSGMLTSLYFQLYQIHILHERSFELIWPIVELVDQEIYDDIFTDLTNSSLSLMDLIREIEDKLQLPSLIPEDWYSRLLSRC